MKMLSKNAELDNFYCEVEKVFLGALIMNTPARAILTHNFHLIFGTPVIKMISSSKV